MSEVRCNHFPGQSECLWCRALQPCPFCGGRCDPHGWLKANGERGPECEGCGATAVSVYAWNFRATKNSMDSIDFLETLRRLHHTMSVHGHVDRDTDLHQLIIDQLEQNEVEP
jgi:hypothetical protein